MPASLCLGVVPFTDRDKPLSLNNLHRNHFFSGGREGTHDVEHDAEACAQGFLNWCGSKSSGYNREGTHGSVFSYRVSGL